MPSLVFNKCPLPLKTRFPRSRSSQDKKIVLASCGAGKPTKREQSEVKAYRTGFPTGDRAATKESFRQNDEIDEVPLHPFDQESLTSRLLQLTNSLAESKELGYKTEQTISEACTAVQEMVLDSPDSGVAAELLKHQLHLYEEPTHAAEKAAATLDRVAAACPGVLLDVGGMDALIMLLSSQYDAKTQAHTVSALRRLFDAEGDTAVTKFILAGGVSAVIKALDYHQRERFPAKEVMLGILHDLLSSADPALNAISIVCSGAVPILLQTMRSNRLTNSECARSVDLLQQLVHMPECMDALLSHHIVGGLVYLINDQEMAHEDTRCEAIALLQGLAQQSCPDMQHAVAVNSARCLVQTLWSGTELESEAAEQAILEISRTPMGAQYMQRAGLVSVVASTFFLEPESCDPSRGIRLIRCLLPCYDALDDLTQPSMLEHFSTALKSDDVELQMLACGTLLEILKQCSGSMATRMQHIVPILVTVARSGRNVTLRRDAAACLDRLLKENGVKDLIVSSGGVGATAALLKDEADLESCSLGLSLLHHLASENQMAAGAFLRRGLVETIVHLLSSSLDVQAVAALNALSNHFDLAGELLVCNALERIIELLQDSTPRADGTCDNWRRKCLTARLFADILSSPQSIGNVPKEAADAIPSLVSLISEWEGYIPSYASDILGVPHAGTRAGRRGKDTPSIALRCLAWHHPQFRERVLEELVLHTWMGNRAKMSKLERL